VPAEKNAYFTAAKYFRIIFWIYSIEIVLVVFLTTTFYIYPELVEIIPTNSTTYLLTETFLSLLITLFCISRLSKLDIDPPTIIKIKIAEDFYLLHLLLTVFGAGMSSIDYDSAFWIGEVIQLFHASIGYV